MSIRALPGDCLAILPTLAADSFDACVTDPPYEIGFMSRRWDKTGVAFRPETWAAVLRVLKPGAHLLAFGAPRGWHRMVCAIEDAGFEIRDQISNLHDGELSGPLLWAFGCLDEQTEVATAEGVKPHHKTKTGDLVLCYDPSTGAYSYQPILEIVEYDYSDTAFRLIGDFGEQVVSRNHRCIVERGGAEVFQFAETVAQEREARVPVLESLPELQQALCGTELGTGIPQQNLQPGMRGGLDQQVQSGSHDPAWAAEGARDFVRGVREARLETECVAQESQDADMQQSVQRGVSRRSVEAARPQGTPGVVARERGCTCAEVHGADQPRMEGWSDLPEAQGRVCGPADQVRPLPDAVPQYGAEGRLRDGAPACGGTGDRASAIAGRGSASREPSRDGQYTDQSDVVCHERPAQGIRAWRGHRTAVVRIVPFHYTGKVWCLRVPTGAFVAVRGGVAFPTGNSGFPKSHDVSRAIDRAAGAEREVVGLKSDPRYLSPRRNSPNHMDRARGVEGGHGAESPAAILTAPATPKAAQWSGWGTALKPAWEGITVARKPLAESTVAGNVLRYGTGAINVDACRIGVDGGCRGAGTGTGAIVFGDGLNGARGRPVPGLGRWPANVTHDGSDEVMAAFARFGESKSPPVGSISGNEPSRPLGKTVYGAMIDREPWQSVGDTGTAARFFKSCSHSADELLIWRAKTILEQWNQELANTADSVTSLSSEAVASALNDVVTLASHGTMRLCQAHSTSATPSELRRISEAVIITILSFDGVCSQESLHERPIHSGCLVKCAAADVPTGTTTITISRWKSDGSAEPVIFSITSLNSDRGEAVSAQSRFHYSAKADATDRLQSRHPTVKPVDLMQWLCRLVTRPGGHILDPFAGSGTTGMAAMAEGFDATLIEKEAEYYKDILRRIAHVEGADTPLFAQVGA